MLAPDKWMIAWNAPSGTYGTKRNGSPREAGAVKVMPWPDQTGESRDYCSSAGCCNFRVKWDHLTQEQLMEELIRGFFDLVLGQGLDPQAIHREFSKIEGYLSYAGNVGLGRGAYVFFQDGKMNPYNP